MSAFYVGNKQISKLANTLHANAHKLNREIAEKMPSDPEVWANTMYGLNVDALKERYGEEGHRDMIEPYEYDANEKFNVVYSDMRFSGDYHDEAQFYKSLSCYLYQCSEGTVYKSEVFNWVEKLYDAVAHQMATRLSEKMGARWE